MWWCQQKIPADHKKEIYFKWKWEKTRNEKQKKNYVSCKHKSFQPLTPKSPRKRGGAEGRQYVSQFYEKKFLLLLLNAWTTTFLSLFFRRHFFFIFLARFFSKKHFLTPILSWKRRICSETCKPTPVVVVAFCAL